MLAGCYFVLSLPTLQSGIEERPELAVFLALGVLGVVVAARVRSRSLRVGVGIVAAYLLMVGSNEAWPIWLHGAALFGVIALLSLVARASDPFARVVGIMVIGLVGFLVLAYSGFVLLLFFGCHGQGCIS